MASGDVLVAQAAPRRWRHLRRRMKIVTGVEQKLGARRGRQQTIHVLLAPGWAR